MARQSQIVGDYTVFTRERLGRGAFGTVYKAQDQHGLTVAAKEIVYEEHQTVAVKEAENFYKLSQNIWNHRNIIKIYDVKREEEFLDAWIFMEFCQFGDLGKYCRDYHHLFNKIYHQLELMCQIAKGLEFLHGQGIVHRDIKPANILLAKDKENKTVIKITDFGLCKYLDPDDQKTSGMTTNVGTPHFKAPEFWQEGTDGKVHYRRSVDVYSAGLTFLAMIQQRAEPGGILAPKAEGSLHVGEKRNAIGQIMCTRHQYHQPELIVAVDRPEDKMVVRRIKELIRTATKFNHLHRLTATDLSRNLEILQIISLGAYSNTARTGTSRDLSSERSVLAQDNNPLIVNIGGPPDLQEILTRHMHVPDRRQMSMIMGYDVYNDLSQYYTDNYRDLVVYGHQGKIIKQIVAALSALHSMGLVHGNLMPENIFVEKAKKPVNTSVKLTAFTLTQFQEYRQETVGQGLPGNNVDAFKAPEYWARSKQEQYRPKQTDDIFAFGLIMRAMLIYKPGEKLQPKINMHTLIKGRTNESLQLQINITQALPVGQIIHELKSFIHPDTSLVENNSNDNARTKTMKAVITLATNLTPEERTTASDIFQHLDRVIMAHVIILRQNTGLHQQRMYTIQTPIWFSVQIWILFP